MDTFEEPKYMPNFGRPSWPGPVSWREFKFPEPDRLLPVYLVVRRASRTGLVSRDQHWFIQWTRGTDIDNGAPLPVFRRLHIVQERALTGDNIGNPLDHLTNWGAVNAVPSGETGIESSQRIMIAEMTKAERVRLEEIANTTPVRVPDGEWNCQDWTKSVLQTAVQNELLTQEIYDTVVSAAEAVAPFIASHTAF